MRLLYDVVQGQCGDSVLCGAKVPTCASPRDKGWEDPLAWPETAAQGRQRQRGNDGDVVGRVGLFVTTHHSLDCHHQHHHYHTITPPCRRAIRSPPRPRLWVGPSNAVATRNAGKPTTTSMLRLPLIPHHSRRCRPEDPPCTLNLPK